MFDESNIFDYNDLQSHVRTVYDVTQIPMEFMSNDQNTQNMNRLINSCTSANINDSYDSFCYLIQNEMQSSLPAKRIIVNCAAHRNTKQDAREAMRVVFSVLTKCICMHKTTFLRMYSNIVLKVILNCMNMQIATQLIMMYNL